MVEHREKRRYAWEGLYLVGIYFQFIFTSAALLMNEAFVNTNPAVMSRRSTVIAFVSLATISAWMTIVSSLFKKTRKCAVPMCFATMIFLMISLAVHTHLQVVIAKIPINAFWQIPVGWAGFAIQVVCCLSAGQFWDSNASEDHYSDAGYLGGIPVFSLSRACIFVASFFQMLGTLGYILPLVTGMMVQLVIPAKEVGWFQGFLIFSAIGCVTSFVLTCGSWMDPHKGRMFILTLLAGLVCMGQAIYISTLVGGTTMKPLSAGFNLDAMRGVWMSWLGFAFYVISLLFTIARSD